LKVWLWLNVVDLLLCFKMLRGDLGI
jgi:hypothetical protein